MGLNDFVEDGLVTYGNPYAHAERKLVPEAGPYDTQVLPPLDVALSATTENQRRSLFRGCWEAIKIRLFNLTENVRAIYSEKLREGEVWEVANQYIFFANVFLRHVPVEQRVALVQKMVSDTSKPALFADSITRTSPTTIIGGDFKDMSFPTGTMTPASVLHEALHYVQHGKLMLPNFSLTHATTYLQRILVGSEAVFDESDKEGRQLVNGLIKSEYENKDKWLDLAIGGKTDEAFKEGVQIAHNPQLQKYLYNENELDRKRMSVTDELARNQMGIKNPYEQSENIGRIRATRAAMLGWATGDKDVAWTILWMHSLGYAFDEVEKSFALAIKEGRIEQLKDYYMFPEVKVEDLGMKNPRVRHLN